LNVEACLENTQQFASCALRSTHDADTYHRSGDDRPSKTTANAAVSQYRAMVAAKLANLKDGQRSDEVSGTSIEVAAEKLNVGRTSVERAKKVQAKGDPDLHRGSPPLTHCPILSTRV
jgi:hypothetical protein